MTMNAADRLKQAMEGNGVVIPKAADTYTPGVSGPPRRALNQQAAERIVQVIPENALVRNDDGTITYKRFTFTAVGVELPDDTTEAEWIDLGQVIKAMESSASWWAGDWAAWANAQGAPYEKIAEDFGYEVETLYSYASVCRAIPTLIRNQGVSFTHHRLVARMEPDEQAAWLARAVENSWRVKDMKVAINGKPERPSLPSTSTSLDSDWKYVRDSWHEGMPAETRQRLETRLEKMAVQIETLLAELKAKR